MLTTSRISKSNSFTSTLYQITTSFHATQLTFSGQMILPLREKLEVIFMLLWFSEELEHFFSRLHKLFTADAFFHFLMSMVTVCDHLFIQQLSKQMKRSVENILLIRPNYKLKNHLYPLRYSTN